MNGREAAILADVMRLAYERGLINILGGNASIRLRDGFLITPSQKPKNMLRAEDMVFVDWDEGPKGHASMEWMMHREVYRASGSYEAVIHTHNPLTLALHEAGLKIDPAQYVEAYSIGPCIEVVPRLPPGSRELAEAVGNAVKRCRVAVLLGHGVVAAAPGIYEALDAVEALEDIARIRLLSLVGGMHQASRKP